MPPDTISWIKLHTHLQKAMNDPKFNKAQEGKLVKPRNPSTGQKDQALKMSRGISMMIVPIKSRKQKIKYKDEFPILLKIAKVYLGILRVMQT